MSPSTILRRASRVAKRGARGALKRSRPTTMMEMMGGGVGSDMRHILTAAHNDKRQARPPTDHFKRLLKEACPNHVYSVRHKLKDCGIVRSFMTSGSLTWGAELDKDLGRSDTTPFPGESTVMVV
jgi:hypothetical protein